MKIKISREDLLHSLDCVKDATDTTNLNPILKSVLLKVKNNTLTIVATNHEIQMSTSCKVKADGDFERIVPAAKLQNILRSLDSDALVDIQFGENNASVKSGRSNFKLVTHKTDDFVPLGETGKLKKFSTKLSCAELMGALKKVAYAANKESHRPALTGILIEQKPGEVNFVATDAFRLAKQSVAVAGEEESNHVVPKKTVDSLLRNLKEDDKLEISHNERAIRFKTETFELISNTIEENFPDYQAVIPRNNKIVAQIDRGALQAVIRRAGALGDRDVIAFFSFKENSLTVETANRDNDRLTDSLDIKYSDEVVETGFNINYINEVLGVMQSDMIKISFRENASSALIEQGDDSKSDGFSYVVMPMRL